MIESSVRKRKAQYEGSIPYSTVYETQRRKSTKMQVPETQCMRPHVAEKLLPSVYAATLVPRPLSIKPHVISLSTHSTSEGYFTALCLLTQCSPLRELMSFKVGHARNASRPPFIKGSVSAPCTAIL